MKFILDSYSVEK